MLLFRRAKHKERRLNEIQQVNDLKFKILSALFSNDTLYQYLVLKGGNAISMIYQLITRASFDLDFSMSGDFPGGEKALYQELVKALNEGMRDTEYTVFDCKLTEKPKNLTDEKASFWGGYECTFKLVRRDFYINNKSDIETLRRNAIMFGSKSRFFIDISRHEYTESKEAFDIRDISLFAYTPAMLVCEKLRALCQQTEEYKNLVNTKTTARSRDFYDIYHLVKMLGINIATEENVFTLKAMFDSKRVPITLLKKIKDYRDFHEADFSSVIDTTLADVEVEEFDYYFEFVIDLIDSLEPFWNE